MIISLTGMMGCGKSSVGRELAAQLGCPFIDLDSYIEKSEGRAIPEIFREKGEAHFRTLELSALREVLSAWSDSPSQSGRLESSDSSARSSAVESSDSPTQRSEVESSDSPTQRSEVESSGSPSQSGRAVSLVLALGGGTPTKAECAEIISSGTLCIYLKASPETLLSHLEGEDAASRPMLSGKALKSRLSELLSEREAIYEKTARHTLVTDGLSVKEIALKITDLLK